MEDAKATGITKDQTVLFLLEHLCGKDKQEVLGREDYIKTNPEQILSVLPIVLGYRVAFPSYSNSFSPTVGKKENI